MATVSPTPSPTNSSNNNHELHNVNFSDAVIAVTVALTVASIIDGAAPRALKKIFPPPILTFILVVIVALIALSINKSNGFFKTISANSVDSDILQTVYLPPLLFSDVMRLNIRTFYRSFWPVCWLIFPGVIGGAALTAVFPLYLMPSGPPFFTAYEAFAFGGALSTTDPIAVLMVLQDIGAPKRLAALVGGESLLNDGSSIVIVTLFLQLQSGINMDGAQIAGFVFQEILAGPCFGLVMGIGTLLIMRSVEKNIVAVVTLSFVMPYLTFTVCLFYFSTSGVLAVITLGLVLNRFGHVFLTKDYEAVEGFWDQVEFFATMILYSQVGIFVAADFLQGSILAIDWASMFCMFLWILLVRLIVVLVSYPILKNTGYGLSWQEAIVVWHAGLRGAVSILLSFAIKNSDGVSEKTGNLVLFFTAGIVVLMLINVVTTGPLCRALGVQFDSNDKVYCKLKTKVQETTLRTLMCTGMVEDIAKRGIGFVAQEELKKSSTNLATASKDATASALGNNNPAISSSKTTNIKNVDSGGRVMDEDMLVKKRQHVCMAFKATFEGLMETELIPRGAYFLLLTAVEVKIDSSGCGSLLKWQDLVGKGTFYRFYAKFVLTMVELKRTSGNCMQCLLHAVLCGCCRRKATRQTNLKTLRKLILDEFTLDEISSENETSPKNTEKDIPADADDVEAGVTESMQNETSPLEDNADVLKSVELLAYCAFALLVAHQRGRRVMTEIFSVLNEQDDRDEPQKKRKRNPELVKIMEESYEDCIRPAQFLDQVFKKFPCVIERIKSSHAKTQVHDKNIQFIGGLKRAGVVSGVALKQLLREVERIDEHVEKLQFPVHPPYSVGPAGTMLYGNPNFGPFAETQAVAPANAPLLASKIVGSLRRRMTSKKKSSTKPDVDLNKQTLIENMTDNVIPQSTEALLPTGATPGNDPMLSTAPASDFDVTPLLPEIGNISDNMVKPGTTEITRSVETAESSATLEDSAKYVDADAETKVGGLKDGDGEVGDKETDFQAESIIREVSETESEHEEQQHQDDPVDDELDRILDKVDEILADQVENDDDIRVRL
jgi:NhaP-type Na+/H+ or K+/H+ antiporter